MSCPKHRELEEALKTERYKDFKPTSAEERLERDCFGNTQADLVAEIRRRKGEEYYQKWKERGSGKCLYFQPTRLIILV